MDVELTEIESSILQNTLRSYLGELQSEIAGTDDRHFRADLKEQRAVLDAIVAKLDATHEDAASAVGEPNGALRVTLWWSTEVVGPGQQR